MNCPHWNPAPHFDPSGNLVQAPACTHPNAGLVARNLARELGIAVPSGTCPLESAARAFCLANPTKVRLRVLR